MKECLPNPFMRLPYWPPISGNKMHIHIYSYLFSFFPPCILCVFMVIIIADNIIFSFLILYLFYIYVCLLILLFSVTTNPSIVSFCNKSEVIYHLFPQQKGGDSSSCHQVAIVKNSVIYICT